MSGCCNVLAQVLQARTLRFPRSQKGTLIRRRLAQPIHSFSRWQATAKRAGLDTSTWGVNPSRQAQTTRFRGMVPAINRKPHVENVHAHEMRLISYSFQ